ncbi:TonB-dependent receptor domain-containing protein [Novosphingobium lentum]|uniref:TonB-dependent receptor domain-containing protein n=1 Tax=Novosphingobium lentum TaxID=145287 RepID=UPI00082FBC79|nr:TonB-dependent receptor [Novosphingobium lentum]
MRPDAELAKFAKAILAAGCALPLPAFGATAVAAPSDAPSGGRNSQTDDIVVQGHRADPEVLVGIKAEEDLGTQDIAAYGLDTVGELLGEIAPGVIQGDDGPVVLVNGRLATGTEEISDLPTEAVSKFQVLTKDAAARLGQGPRRRVINLVIKRDHRQRTASSDYALATAGNGTSAGAALDFVEIAAGNRTTLTVRERYTAPLLEADRNIPSDVSGIPYDLIGNILPFPAFGLEIDPALSALAGSPVGVAAVPAGLANPQLSDFARGAGRPNVPDIGRYRTLVGERRSYEMNATIARSISRRTSLTFNLFGNISIGKSLIGAPGVLVALPAKSAFSPFSRDVSIARYLDVAFDQSRHASSISAKVALNTGVGKFSVAVLASYKHRNQRNETDRQTDLDALQAGIDSGAIDPFAPLPAALLRVTRRDLTRSVSNSGEAAVTVSGDAVKLPAGWANLTLHLGGSIIEQSGLSNITGSPLQRDQTRKEVYGQISFDLPVASKESGFLGALGDFRINGNAGFRSPSDTRRLTSHGYGITWQPSATINLRASVNHDETAPSLSLLADPVSVVGGVRFYDFIRAQTVQVELVTGGNPDLLPEKRRTISVGGSFQMLNHRRLTFSADYTATRTVNAVSGLPPLSVAVQAAFADRFIRDGSGRVIAVDSRAVSFAADDRQQLRWSINLVTCFGQRNLWPRRQGQHSAPVNLGRVGSDDGGGPTELAAAPATRPWRLNFNLSHTITLKAQRLARPGLPVVDLLRGGADGYGEGQPRHTVQFTLGLAGKGVGVQVNGVWRSGSDLRVGTTASPGDLHFSARCTANMRIFAEMETLAPDRTWSKGLRLTLSTDNIFNSRQAVRDSSGFTPARYQTYLLEPLGRTVKFSLRKMF